MPQVVGHPARPAHACLARGETRRHLMTVRDLMTRDVVACTPESDLSAAAMLMWQNDCGTVPVVNDQGRVIGVITDRDIAIAAGSRHASTDQIRVTDVVNGHLITVQPDDDIHAALEA